MVRRKDQTSRVWRCPKCRRQFRNRNQAHSCKSRSVESFFEDRPELRPLFERVVAHLEQLGPIRVDASPSGVNIAARSHFAGARPARDGLRVGFVLPGKIEHPRIVNHEAVGGGRYVHRVVIGSLREVDAELLGWLTQAHAQNVGGGPTRRRRSA